MKRTTAADAKKLIRTMLGFGSVIRPYMAREVRVVASAFGITERDVEILDFVASKGTTNFAEIAERMHLEKKPGTSAPRVSAALSNLHGKHGLVRMTVNPDDRRRPVVSLSAKGKKVVERVSSTREAVYEQIRLAMDLSPDQVRELQRIFERGTANFSGFLAQEPK